MDGAREWCIYPLFPVGQRFNTSVNRGHHFHPLSPPLEKFLFLNPNNIGLPMVSTDGKLPSVPITM